MGSCWLFTKIVVAFVGVLVGISAFFWFWIAYANYNAAIWALLSGLLSMGTFHLHQLYARNLIDEWYDIDALSAIEKLGVLGTVVSVVAFSVNLGLAIYWREGLDLKTYGTSHIPAVIFAIMFLRAALVLAWFARKYAKYVRLCDPAYVYRAHSQQQIPDLDLNSINYM